MSLVTGLPVDDDQPERQGVRGSDPRLIAGPTSSQEIDVSGK
jgi:hypothetical protein